MLTPKGVNNFVAVKLIEGNTGKLLQYVEFDSGVSIAVGEHILFDLDSKITPITIDNTSFAIIPIESIMAVLIEN